MLEVTMTPEEAKAYCRRVSHGWPCQILRRKWGCGDPECVMCCEVHRQGRSEDKCDSCASIGDLQERIAELREQNAALKAVAAAVILLQGNVSYQYLAPRSGFMGRECRLRTLIAHAKEVGAL